MLVAAAVALHVEALRPAFAAPHSFNLHVGLSKILATAPIASNTAIVETMGLFFRKGIKVFFANGFAFSLLYRYRGFLCLHKALTYLSMERN